MPDTISTVPVEVIDLAIRRILARARFPKKKYKIPGKKNQYRIVTLDDDGHQKVIHSTEDSGFWAVIEFEGQRWSISYTRHKLRFWVNSNWNTDHPYLEGEQSMVHFRRVIEQIRDEKDEEESKLSTRSEGVE